MLMKQILNFFLQEKFESLKYPYCINDSHTSPYKSPTYQVIV